MSLTGNVWITSGSISAIQQTNCNTKYKIPADTIRFLITLVQPTQNSFGCTNTHFYMHTYSLFGFQVHSPECDKAHTSVPTPVRRHLGSNAHLPGVGTLGISLCCHSAFQQYGLCGHPHTNLHFLAVAFPWVIALRYRHTPTGMQKYGFYICI